MERLAAILTVTPTRIIDDGAGMSKMPIRTRGESLQSHSSNFGDCDGPALEEPIRQASPLAFRLFHLEPEENIGGNNTWRVGRAGTTRARAI